MWSTFLSLFTGSNKTAVYALAGVVAALVLAAACGLCGWHYGYQSAESTGKAALATVEKQYADASANATATALQNFERETQRANGIAAQLIETRRALSSARANITGRIEHAAASVPADCAFGPEFVGLWNDAHGLRAGALPEGAAPGGTAGQPGQTGAAGAGIRGNASVADLLAHGRDYGAYCQGVEAQRDGLMQFVTEGK